VIESDQDSCLKMLLAHFSDLGVAWTEMGQDDAPRIASLAKCDCLTSAGVLLILGILLESILKSGLMDEYFAVHSVILEVLAGECVARVDYLFIFSGQ
jgi:hypothetical protein